MAYCTHKFTFQYLGFYSLKRKATDHHRRDIGFFVAIDVIKIHSYGRKRSSAVFTWLFFFFVYVRSQFSQSTLNYYFPFLFVSLMPLCVSLCFQEK